MRWKSAEERDEYWRDLLRRFDRRVEAYARTARLTDDEASDVASDLWEEAVRHEAALVESADPWEILLPLLRQLCARHIRIRRHEYADARGVDRYAGSESIGDRDSVPLAEAEEVLWGVWATAADKETELSGSGDASGVLDATVREESARHVHVRRYEVGGTDVVAGIGGESEESPDAETTDAETSVRWIQRAWWCLTPMQRVVLKLRFWQSWAYRRIAALTGMPEATARSHASQGLTRLRRFATTDPNAGSVRPVLPKRAQDSRAQQRRERRPQLEAGSAHYPPP